MALRDFNTSMYPPECVELNQAEALIAHKRNGTLEQRDWSKISRSAVACDLRTVHDSNAVQFIIDADLDTRHVAILCAPEAHLDPYEISQIVRSAPVDGSTILAAYLYALSDILEGYYSKACRVSNYHPFIKDGEAEWTTMAMGRDHDDYMILLAKLWQASEQTFLFDAGRKQILYAAFEADLEANGIKPDWFLPSQSFLPFDGKEPKTNLIMWDLQVFEIPTTGFDWLLGAPKGPRSMGSRLIRWLKER